MGRRKTGLVPVAVMGIAVLCWARPSDAQCRGNMLAFENALLCPVTLFKPRK